MSKPVERVLVTNVTAANTGTSIDTIISGDILVFSRTFGTALTGSPTITSAEGNDQIHIAQGLAPEGSMKILWSFPIDLKTVTKASLRTYVAPVEKVQTISFPTTINDRSAYELTIVYNNPTYRVLQQKPQAERYYYTTSASASQAELAFALAAAAGNDRYANISRKVEVLSDGTFTALSNNATVNNLSTTVTSTAHGLAVGDYVRIGGTGATIPVYKVATVVSSSVVTLTEKYQGASGTVLAADIGIMTVTTTFSIRITGIAIPATAIPDLYDKVNFDSTIYEINGPVLPEFTVAETTPLNLGVGFWQQVRDKEYLSSGYLGVQNRTMFPGNTLNPATHAVSGNQYDLFTISHYERVVGLNGEMYNDPKLTTIAFKSDVTTKRVAVIDILESLFESVGVFVE